jgi:hypothetical protein
LLFQKLLGELFLIAELGELGFYDAELVFAGFEEAGGAVFVFRFDSYGIHHYY